MEIKSEFKVQPDEDGRPISRLSRIIIEVDGPADDPRGDLAGLVTGRLEAFLRLYGNPSSAPVDEADAYELLRDFGHVANMTDTRYGELMWACRDTLGMSWRRIASACEVAPTSVRRRVASVRRDYRDEHNAWRDADGLHEGTADEARRHVALAAQRDESETHVTSGARIGVVGIVNNYGTEES